MNTNIIEIKENGYFVYLYFHILNRKFFFDISLWLLVDLF